MPRNMSFALTLNQVRNREKDVTRRFGWWFLKPGDVVNAVEKGMGLKPGEKIKRICQIEIVSIRAEPLNVITHEDCAREGFPDFRPADFVAMLTSHYGCPDDKQVNRIEFRYLDTPTQQKGQQT
ncbi:ASCH domain-containing protein [Pacificoceanicola onchidii]|uniref:ASCH domain-containing protein n=1 Tax=Pacificoceanicola onchidii TaxID=2562685 RepID=UPI0010A65BF5|nr:ASCH domain-containing protein [Pacificoceanicola onchidii]